MKFIELDPLPLLEEDYESSVYVGEMLYQVIDRASELGVGVGSEFASMYDDGDDVDIACDIRADLYDFAENATEQRSVREMMTKRAAAAAAAEPTPPVEPTPPTE